MRFFVFFLPLSLLAGVAAAQQSSQPDNYTSTLSERILNLSKVLDKQKRVIDANATLFGNSNDKKAFVFHGLPAGDATIADALLKNQHLNLWNQNSVDIQELSQMLKDTSNQIKGMSPAIAIETVNAIVISDHLKTLFSVAPDGRALPDPPHLLSPLDKPASLGGYVVGPGSSTTIDYPAVAEVAYNFQGLGSSTLCTGTLISTSKILTAAHCFCEFVSASTYAGCMKATYKRGLEELTATDAKYVSVFFQDIGAIAAKSIKINPDFNFPKGDLAIVELPAPISRIAPAPVNDGASPKKGSIGFIVGYGLHSAVDASGKPKAGAVSPRPGTQGIKLWARVALGNCAGEDKNKNLICWSYVPSVGDRELGSTCNGDSGGPLFISLNGMWSLAGVTSGGRLDCIPSQKSKDESYDVDVSKYISWIRANANVVSASSSDKFIVDKSNRAFGSVYHLFVAQADKLDADVFIPAGLPALNFAVNATPTYSSLQIELIPPGSNLAACTNKSPDAYVTCSIDAPMQGTWRLSVSGSRPQETQVIGNVVR